MSIIGKMKANNAFTLIEILMVVIVIGIFLGLAAPNFSKGYSRFQLDHTADDLLTASRWAQAMAIGQERIYALSITGDHRSYGLVRAKSNDGTIDDTNDPDNFEPVNGPLGRMHQLPEPLRLDPQKDLIEFHPDGTIDPAVIQLSSSEQKITLSSIEMRGMMTKVDNE